MNNRRRYFKYFLFYIFTIASAICAVIIYLNYFPVNSKVITKNKTINETKLTEDLTIDLCYLLLYRFGGVKVVAITMLIEWFVYLLKDWIIPIYKEIKLEIKLKRLDKKLKELEMELEIEMDLSEETC